MGQFFMRTAPNSDLYVGWSTETDRWFLIGTRGDMRTYMYDHMFPRLSDEPEQMLARMDQTGTSYRHGVRQPLTGSWECEYLRFEANGKLIRSNLHEYCSLLDGGFDEEAAKLIEPLWSDDDV